MKYDKNQIMQKYRSLPEDIKDAIFGTDTADMMRKISTEHKLTIRQMGELADETGLLMMGFTKLNEYIPNITKRLNINKEIAKQIAQSVNARIFARIRNSLKKVHVSKKENLLEETENEQIDQLAPPKNTSPTSPLISPSLTFAKKDFTLTEPKTEREMEEKITPEPPAKLETVSEKKPEPIKIESVKIDETKNIKDIFKERQNETFRSKIETSETTEHPVSRKATNKTYPGGIDPYRETID